MLQTLSVPQAVPLVTAVALSRHPIAGAQTVVPEWHGLVGTQERPAEHATQTPPLQTWPVPQDIPSCALPDSRHTGVPVLHVVVPTRHAFPTTAHADPATHAPQVPDALQTMPAPHAFPLARFTPVSLQTGMLPVHVSAPLWQGLAGVHAPPAVHIAQVPASQTLAAPQAVPSGWLSDSTQMEAPVLQSARPTRQGLPTTSQAVPSAHARQAPSRQTDP